MNRILRHAALAVCTFAMLGISSQALSAGWCGGGSSGGTAAGGSSGGGGGTGVPQPSSGAERVDKPVQQKRRVVGAPAPVESPSFQRPSSEVLENAANGKQAIFIFFPGEKDDANSYFGGADYKALEGSAQFVAIPYNSDREPSPLTEESLVPTSKLLSDNPSRDYGIKAYPAFIIADSYGNVVLSLSGKKPAAKELETAFSKVSAKMDDNSKKLQRRLDNARKAWEAKDATKAMSEIRGNFKDGLVGYDAQNETIRIYHEVVEAARAQVETLKGDTSADAVKALKALKNTFKDTELENDIEAALKGSK